MTEVSVQASHVPVMSNSVTVSRSAIMYRLGGRQYPMQSVSNCKVCQSSYRLEIERSLIRSYAPASIYRSLPPEAQEALSVRNITDHANKHLPLDHAIRQAAVTARTRELNRDIETVEGALADHILFARVGLQRVYERLVDGSVQPDIKDGIAFAQLLLKVEQEIEGGLDAEMYAQGFMVYMAALQRVCNPDQIRQMGEIIHESPILNALLTLGNRSQQRETIEVEAHVTGG